MPNLLLLIQLLGKLKNPAPFCAGYQVATPRCRVYQGLWRLPKRGPHLATYLLSLILYAIAIVIAGIIG